MWRCKNAKRGVVENADQSTWWIWIRACSRNFTPACIPILQQLTPIYILDGPASSMCASCTLAKMQKWHCKHKYHKYYTLQYHNYKCCPIPSVQLIRCLFWSLHTYALSREYCSKATIPCAKTLPSTSLYVDSHISSEIWILLLIA